MQLREVKHIWWAVLVLCQDTPKIERKGNPVPFFAVQSFQTGFLLATYPCWIPGSNMFQVKM